MVNFKSFEKSIDIAQLLCMFTHKINLGSEVVSFVCFFSFFATNLVAGFHSFSFIDFVQEKS